jgi:hypothetical protein
VRGPDSRTDGTLDSERDARHVVLRVVVKAMPKITRTSRQQGPFVYNITASGIVSQIPHRTLPTQGEASWR